MMEATRSSETSLLTGATRRNIPEDSVLQEILRSREEKEKFGHTKTTDRLTAGRISTSPQFSAPPVSS
jgi:hypothetical protein